MKVVAKIDEDRVLCEVSKDEIAHLNGFRSAYNEGCNIQALMKVGAECNLQKMVATSYFVRNIRDSQLKNAREKLEVAMREIDNAVEVIAGEEMIAFLSEKNVD